VALVRGFLIPFYGFGLVFGRAFAVIVSEGDEKLRFDDALVGGLLKPFYGFGKAFRRAMAGIKSAAKA
jgi:hypothetical protein